MSLYELQAKTTDGKHLPLSEFRNQVLLFVNVASKCGFTSQYKGLEELYKKHKDSGLMILGFPCNQFGAQEPGTNEEIQSFCKLTYDVSFPILDKIDVNGDDADPIYHYLKEAAPGILNTKAIKWNFTKFLVGKNESSIKRYASTDTPESLEKDILSLLNK